VLENDIYIECPTYQSDILTLRLIAPEDAHDLLRCYSDGSAVPLFNSDNCNGDNFHYLTIERMKAAIYFWQFSYEQRYFVRFTIVLNKTGEKIGTVEMFKREADDEFNYFGILRIDLQSQYEEKQYIDEILDIAHQNFYEAFEVNSILTKAIPDATERIESLTSAGYVPLNKKFMGLYDDYYVREK
jgi:hypothetical protein